MKKTVSLLLVFILMLTLSACGSASREAQSGGAYYNAAYDGDAYEAAEIYTEAPAMGLSMTAAKTAAPEEDAPEANPEKIIYSSDVKVETTDFEGSLAKLDELLHAVGGWVESSSVNGANFYNQSRGYQSTRSASYTLRIPSSRFDELMATLSSLGNIPYTHTYTENVTAQYYDTEAHLKAYQTQEARLLEMMEVAETVEDIVILEDRLTELRYRIESLQSTLKNWDRRVSYSTVSLTVQEVQEYTPEPEVRVSYGQRLWRSLRDGVLGVTSFFKELLVWFVGALPTLVILTALFFLLRPVFRKWRAKRREKKAARRGQ